MALSSDFKKNQPIEDLEEVIEALEKLLDRTKIMFEQYFMGIQKVAPMQLHRDVERKVRELTQQQIRNTGLRFRFTTLCQKFGSYNTYWKRTLREIEQGRYVRDLVRAKRRVEQNGEDLPEELLVKLPRLVQDRIRRDRARMVRTNADEAERASLEVMAQASIMFSAPQPTVHEISEEDTLFDDRDIESLFGALDDVVTMPVDVEDPPMPKASAPPPQAAPPPPQAAPPQAAAPPPRPVAPPPPPKPVVPPRPIVPASVTTRLKPTGATPPPIRTGVPLVPPPLKPVAGSSVPPPRPVAPPPRPAAPPVAKPAAPPVAKPAAPPVAKPAAAPIPPGMSEKQCRDLHARYAKARELVGDKTDVSYDKLLATLNKQAPAIMKEHGARAVDFQVVVRGDKVILKAKPVK